MIISLAEWNKAVNEDMVPTPEMKTALPRNVISAVAKLLYKNRYDPNKCIFSKMGNPRKTIEAGKLGRVIIVLKIKYPKTKDPEELEQQKEIAYIAIMSENTYGVPKMYNVTSGRAEKMGDIKDFDMFFDEDVKFIGFTSPIERLKGTTKEQRDMVKVEVPTLQQRLAKYKQDKKLAAMHDDLKSNYSNIDDVLADIAKFDLGEYIRKGTNSNDFIALTHKISALGKEMTKDDRYNFVRVLFGKPNMTKSEVEDKVNEDPGYGTYLSFIGI